MQLPPEAQAMVAVIVTLCVEETENSMESVLQAWVWKKGISETGVNVVLGELSPATESWKEEFALFLATYPERWE